MAFGISVESQKTAAVYSFPSTYIPFLEMDSPWEAQGKNQQVLYPPWGLGTDPPQSARAFSSPALSQAGHSL